MAMRDGIHLFGGWDNDHLYGNDGNGRFVGGYGADVMFGSQGRDRLNGGPGTDAAYGGANNDTVIVDTETDRAVETASGGLDALLINAPDYTLDHGGSGFFELVNVRIGAGAARLDANDIDNTVLGNPFSNTLLCRSGTNTMTGDSGDDTFVVETSADVLRDHLGQGVDLVRAKVDFTLPDGSANAYLDDLRMQGGFGNIDSTGNSLDNNLEENNGNNRLAGNQGEDSLLGGEGAGSLFGGQGSDRFEGESGADWILVGREDVAFGGSGTDDCHFNGALL